MASTATQLEEERAAMQPLKEKLLHLEKAVADLSAQEAASENELRAQCGAAEARARWVAIAGCCQEGAHRMASRTSDLRPL